MRRQSSIKHTNLILSVLFAFALPSCRIFQLSTESVKNFVDRGSCISIDIPPITLTPERTAAERQLVGEDREIEKDGWLVASSQSTLHYSGGGEGLDADEAVQARRLYREKSLLDFYGDLLVGYKSEGVLGEGRKGHVLLVPESVSPRQGRYRRAEEVEKALLVASEVNHARDWIYRYYLNLELARVTPDTERVEREFRMNYLFSSRSGEWIQDEDLRWVRVR